MNDATPNPQSPVTPQPPAASQPSADDLTILVMEDERPLLDAIKLKLEKVGLTVVTARTVAQGLDYLSSLKKVDAVWLDHYLLGKESGLDFVAKLKENGSPWANIPVFVVSNTASNEKVNAYLRFGINKYYTKSNYRLDQIVKDILDDLQRKKE